MTGVKEFSKHFNGYSERKLKRENTPFLNDYYNYISLNHEASTAWMYLNYVTKFVETENIVDPSQIKLGHYTGYFAKLKDMTASYLKTTYAALKLFSKFLKLNYGYEDYMENIERPRKKDSAETISKRESDFMSPEEIKEYLKKVSSVKQNDTWRQRDYTIVKILLMCGIRRSALQKLDVGDVDLSEQTILVTEKGARVRKIYLSDELVDDIKVWLKYRDALNPKDSALFISNRKTRLNYLTINQIVQKYGENVHPHKFRASYATILYDKTKDLYFVQQCMGHTTPGMTERYIRGQKDNATKKAGDIIGNIF